ncbi:hypothetical protein, partial [Actinoplanes philippinensis]|uniref:hypothetical protein n=1 Tax=Actinoplanes philippinensis TaxID=35752 RepID=UPI0033F08482
LAQRPAAKQAGGLGAVMGTDRAGGGCDEPAVMSASALEALNGDLSADASAVGVAQADPLVVAAKEAYVSCMGSYGYTVTDTAQINELIDDYNEAHAYPWPSDLPDVLPSTADAATKVKFAAANARTAAALAAIDQWTAQAEDSHSICVAWYDNEYERAYTDALNG